MAGAAGGDVGASRLRVDGTEAGAQAGLAGGLVQPGRGGRADGGAAALVDGLRGRGAGCAGRTRAGGQPDAGPGGATAQGGARPVAFQRGPGLAADRPARRRPAPAQVVWSARRERAVRRRSRAGRIAAGAGRTVHRLLPGRFRRPLGTRPVRPHRRRHGRGARERRRRRSRLARGQGVGGRRGRARLYRTARAQRRHQVLSGLLDDQRHLLALVQERRRAGIASDFDVDRASVLEAETAAQLPLSAQLARQHAQRLAVLTGESQIAPGCWRPPASPCRAASRPRRCRPISCASGRTSVARNSRCCRPRPNYGCRSPSYTRA